MARRGETTSAYDPKFCLPGAPVSRLLEIPRAYEQRSVGA
jgi:hypothetical protein